MNMSKGEYRKFAGKNAPHSTVGKNMLKAFVSGGAICAVGQGLLNFYGSLGLDKDLSGTMGSITLVFLGALLTGLGIYDNIASFAGAGTLVPITGFANSIAAPAIEFRTEKLVTGTAVRMFTIAGPVIVFGISAGVVYGVIYFLCSVL